MTFAEVEVIDDPTTVRAVESWSLDELDIADAISGPLAEPYSKRKQQRQDPAFGKLLGKSRVYLRIADAQVDLGVWRASMARTGGACAKSSCDRTAPQWQPASPTGR